VVKNVGLSGDTASRDVAITPDGSLALVRNENVANVTIVSLTDDTVVELVLPATATDLDLSVDGSRAVAVLRETGQIALLPLPDVVSDPSAMAIVDVPGAKVGSVALAPGSTQGFFYTNAEPSSVLTVLDTSAPAPTPQQLSLHAAIDAVFPTPGAAHAVVLHDSVNGSSSYAAAVSLVPVTSQLPSKIVGLEQRVAALAISPAGNRALVATGDELSSSFELVLAKLPSLAVTRHALASRPIAAGVVAGANRGFVVQEHPDGRITFVDLDDGEMRTLTGFELATQVVTGSQP
jgi:DNA-binding beta-propeller fold protein YncE